MNRYDMICIYDIYVELLNAEFVKYVANKVSKNEIISIVVCFILKRTNIKVIIIIIIITAKLIPDYRC